MPIDYKKYPENWKDRIRPDILKRDNYKCVPCGVRQRARGYRDSNKRFVECDGFMEVWAYNNNIKIFTIFLAIAHLDHNIQNNKYANLQSMCQKCHNNYDQEFRKLNKMVNRSKRTNSK